MILKLKDTSRQVKTKAKKEKNIEFARLQMADTSERKQKDLAEIQQMQTKKTDLIAEIESRPKDGPVIVGVRHDGHE